MGNEANILVRPNLSVNGNPCDLSLLKNVKAKVTTSSYIDKIPITKIFDKLEIWNGKELKLGFPVPANLEWVDVELSAEMMNITKGEKEKF